MGARITRRDFLNGIAVTAGAASIPAIIPPEMWAAAAPDLEAQNVAGYYPPAKFGLRGSHAGSFETMHKLRDGAFSGGAFSLESPLPYSPVAKGLIAELGTDVPPYPKYLNKDLYRSFGLKPRIF